jgi:hypothetical protein
MQLMFEYNFATWPYSIPTPLYLFQVSADDRRHLCERTKLSTDAGLAVYSSIVYQLKDANMEASGTCDFVCRAFRIVYKTGEDHCNGNEC